MQGQGPHKTRRRANSDPHRLPRSYNPYTMLPMLSPHYAPVPNTPVSPMGGFPPFASWPYPSPPYWPSELEPAKSTNEHKESPSVHSLLSPAYTISQPHILYDVRFRPEKSYVSSNPPSKLTKDIFESYATSPPLPKIRLVCKHLPWMITVKNPTGVTVADVLDAIHTNLQHPFTEGEWWMATDADRAKTMAAYKHNCSDAPGTTHKRKLEEGVKRVDYLADKTMVIGIFRSTYEEAFIKTRVPDKKAHPETWVLEMGSS